jgi:hypothetical protein
MQSRYYKSWTISSYGSISFCVPCDLTSIDDIMADKRLIALITGGEHNALLPYESVR